MTFLFPLHSFVTLVKNQLTVNEWAYLDPIFCNVYLFIYYANIMLYLWQVLEVFRSFDTTVNRT